MLEEDRKYRAFLSYSHQDLRIAQAVDSILKRNGLRPMWDEHFAYGQGFHEQIKKFIAHAHVFLPILTHSANQRNWVHQEIGYATALNVPVLPLAIGEVPGEMIHHLHAVRIEQNEAEQINGVLPDAALENLARALTLEEIERLIRERSDTKRVPFACAEHRGSNSLCVPSLGPFRSFAHNYASFEKKGLEENGFRENQSGIFPFLSRNAVGRSSLDELRRKRNQSEAFTRRRELGNVRYRLAQSLAYQKGHIVTELELAEAVLDGIKREVASYEVKLSRRTGAKIHFSCSRSRFSSSLRSVPAQDFHREMFCSNLVGAGGVGRGGYVHDGGVSEPRLRRKQSVVWNHPSDVRLASVSAGYLAGQTIAALRR